MMMKSSNHRSKSGVRFLWSQFKEFGQASTLGFGGRGIFPLSLRHTDIGAALFAANRLSSCDFWYRQNFAARQIWAHHAKHLLRHRVLASKWSNR